MLDSGNDGLGNKISGLWESGMGYGVSTGGSVPGKGPPEGKSTTGREAANAGEVSSICTSVGASEGRGTIAGPEDATTGGTLSYVTFVGTIGG